MKNIWVIIGGVITAVLGVIALINWAPAIWIILKGIIVFVLIIGGVVSVAVGISNIKDKLAEKKEEKK